MRKLIDRIDALTLRERLLMLAAMLFVLFSLWNLLLMQPLHAKQTAIQKQIGQLHQQIDSLNTAIRTSVVASQRDPNAAIRAQIEQVNHQIDSLDKQLKEATGGLVEPKEMAPLLEEVLNKQHGLKLISIHSEPPQPLLKNDLTNPDTKSGLPGVGLVYRHGLTIELKGSYSATLDYLRALEKLHWRFFWDKVELHTEHYPNNRITIVVHTISLHEVWLGV
jgi:MSHA biogenesis protein MshJ